MSCVCGVCVVCVCARVRVGVPLEGMVAGFGSLLEVNPIFTFICYPCSVGAEQCDDGKG